MIKINYSIFIFILLSTFSFAQKEENSNPFWLNWSLGGSPKYINGSLSFNKSLGEDSYQVSINSSSKDILSGRSMATGSIAYGKANVNNHFVSAFYAGPTVSYGEAKGPQYFWGFGFGLNAQAYFMPLYKLFPGVGLGIEAYYNFNIAQTIDADYRHIYSIRVGFCLTDLHDFSQ